MPPETAAPASSELPPVAKPPQPDPAVARLEAEVARNKAEMDRMKSMIFAPPQQQPASQPTQPSEDEMRKEFFKNPIQATTAIAYRMAQEMQQRNPNHGFDTQVEMARNLAKQEQPEVFDKYLAEIEAHVQSVEPNLRINTNVWKNAAKIVKANHFDELVDAAVQRKQAPPENRSAAIHVSSGSGPAVPDKAPPASREEPLSDLEKKFLKKFKGMSEADYRQGKLDNANQSDVILDPIGPSSWDSYVTFDSDDKRRKAREERKRQRAAGK